ncbi:MAG: DUF302 domain-containing protein [Candidatus Eremiobacterota bacterium]
MDKKIFINAKSIYMVSGGFLFGLFTAIILVYMLMPAMMINVHESKYSFNETISRLEKAIENENWEHPGTRNLQKSITKTGIDFPKKVVLIELCQPEYAKDILTDNTHLATLMPCAFAVYEGKNGKVYISGMNTGLMGKMFGGKIAEVMGEKVSKDEEIILSSVLN